MTVSREEVSQYASWLIWGSSWQIDPFLRCKATTKKGTPCSHRPINQDGQWCYCHHPAAIFGDGVRDGIRRETFLFTASVVDSIVNGVPE